MLRKLAAKDADKMLEWMHDEAVNRNFRFNFAAMTKERALNFIENSFTDENQHFAIVDAEDEYIGTISLKNISPLDKNAEYAIVIRRKFWGTGIAKKATDEILKYAFENLNLHRVYLNVLDENIRANKFYRKYGFIFEGTFKQHLNLQIKNGGGYELQGFELVRAHKRGRLTKSNELIIIAQNFGDSKSEAGGFLDSRVFLLFGESSNKKARRFYTSSRE